jgi:hypothetical protein
MLKCHDCGAQEGMVHEQGCDMERCPRCNMQAITCYKHCVYPSGKFRQSFLEGERVPYLTVPNMCRMCGEAWPQGFAVDDDEWDKYVVPDLRYEILCHPCYDDMKVLFPEGWRKAPRWHMIARYPEAGRDKQSPGAGQ